MQKSNPRLNFSTQSFAAHKIVDKTDRTLYRYDPTCRDYFRLNITDQAKMQIVLLPSFLNLS